MQGTVSVRGLGRVVSLAGVLVVSACADDPVAPVRVLARGAGQVEGLAASGTWGYAIRALGLPTTATEGMANAINDNDVVVGWTNHAGQTTPTMWRPGQIARIMEMMPGAFGSEPYDINTSAGLSVGAAWGPTGIHPVAWSSRGKLRVLPALTNSTAAYGINNRGVVVGEDCYFACRALLWSGLTAPPQVLAAPPSPWVNYGARSINDAGDVVGWVQEAFTNLPRHAFRWNANGTMEDLGPLTGPDSGQALRINNHGDVAGMASRKGASYPVVWYASGQVSWFDQLQVNGVATSISDMRRVVGTFEVDIPFTATDPTSWEVLPQFGTPTPGGAAKDVNTCGKIVGWSRPTGRRFVPAWWVRADCDKS